VETLPGVETLPATSLHQATSLRRTVIIALTASAFEEQQEKVLSAGCDDIVRKPFKEQVLFGKMAQYLGVRYLYQVEQIQKRDRCQTAATTLTAADLAGQLTQIQPEWRSQLHQAAIQLNEPQMLSLIEQIWTENAAIANTLAELVNEFRFDILATLTQPTDAPK
ncbi:MAG: response regulator, partial [Cyanothece sp. SIO1E1]|nr:response regulator [Cyanothece sp. SIO1E1]